MFERGEHVSFANCGLAYYIGGEITDREKLLVQTPESLKKRFRIDVRVRNEVIAIDRVKKEVQVRDLATGRAYSEKYDKIILSPGTEPLRPPLPGIDHPRIFVLRSMADSDRIRAAVDAGAKSALVIGGGYIGLELAENLRRRGLEVTLAQSHPQVMVQLDPEMAAPIHQTLRAHGVVLVLNDPAAGFAERDGRIAAKLKSGREIVGDFAVIGAGVRPETKLARQAGLQVGQRGGIVVNEYLQTSDPDIYAVGDAIEVKDFVTGQPTIIPLGGPANRQGRIAADNCLGRNSTYEGSQGTAILRVFELTVALTGASEKTLKQVGMKYEKIYVHPFSHANYYPGAAQMTIKLLFAPDTGRVLGAQIVGGEGVDKRIDVLATAIRAKLTVYDLEHLELAYAPQYGSAKDAINFAGFAAANVLRGDVTLAQPEDLPVPSEAGPLALDVRTAAECQAGGIPNAKLIPIDELRDRLHELPKDREIWAYCAAGLRGYLASRILAQHGFKVRNIAGGYKTYCQYHPKESPSASAPSPSPGGPPRASNTGQKEVTLDCRGLQCPGPIIQVKKKMDEMPAGGRLRVCASDLGFAADIAAWCHSTGNKLLGVSHKEKMIEAVIEKPDSQAAPASTAQPTNKKKTIIVFSNDLDRVMAAFVIANGAAAAGSEVTMFFTFWGLNVLRRPEGVPVEKGLLDRMFGWMMPRGARKLRLSKMHMAGIGTALMKHVMKQKNVNALPELLQMARQAGIRLVACTMSMDVMGIKKEELIDGLEFGGVAAYLDAADESNVNLFI
jgi:NADPH-dependent 2,4-dienoyl-CoA reductase/sulfur reductase-like enzyme/peroxiredoxin family protein/rhodanese-related sulfurtransferase/TusA-related sulfurtransferase